MDQASRKNDWRFRYALRSNTSFAWVIRGLANMVLVVGRPLPERVRRQPESFARLLRLLAQLIVLPEYVYKFMQWRPTLKGMLDGGVLGGVLGFWVGFYLHGRPAAFTVVLWVLVLVLALAFALLTSFLFVSGDVYFGRQDEFQKATANEASATTLHAVSVLLLALFLAYLIRPAWRDAVYFHFSVLYFFGRLTYLFRLTQLRWQEMADIEVIQDGDGDGETASWQEQEA